MIGQRWVITSEDSSLENPILFIPDGVDNESFSVSDKVAEHRLSKGSFVNLHTVFGAETYNCTVYVYSSNLTSLASKNKVFQGLYFQNPSEYEVLPASSGGLGRLLEAKQTLKRLRGKLLTIWTSKLGTLTNFQLTGVDIAAGRPNELVLNLSFREVRYAELVLSGLPTLPQAKKAEKKEECQPSSESTFFDELALLFPFQGTGEGIGYSLLIEDGGQYIGTDGVPRSKAQGLAEESFDLFSGVGNRVLELGGLQ